MRKGLKYGLITVAVAGVIGFGIKDYHDSCNGVMITVADGNVRRHYVGPHGEKSLTLRVGDKFDVGWGAADEDKLESIMIYLNDEIIDENKDVGYGRRGVMTRHVDFVPGEYTLKIIACDTTGQERTDSAKLTILEKIE